MDSKLLAVAAGKEPADLAVVNGKIVNVYSGEIYEGGVAVAGDKIAAIGDVAYAIGEGTQVIDAKGRYLTPGFLDGHLHPESTSLAIRSFAELVLKHGTTGIMTDLHEVGVVGGLEAIEAVLEEAADTELALYFVVPSHVPFAPNLETSGGEFNPEIIKKALARPDAVGLSECVGSYILTRYQPLFDGIELAREAGKSLQGHLPFLNGKELNQCLVLGISSDHESMTEEDALSRVRGGASLMLRESSVGRNLLKTLKPVGERGLDTTNVSIVTDDLHTVDAVENGHLDARVRTALKGGLDFVKAIQMVTLNAARAFHLDNRIGGLAPGKRADINITTGPEDFQVCSVVAGGKLVSEEGKFLHPYAPAKHKPCLLNTMKLKRPCVPEDFMIRVDKDAKAAKIKGMKTLDWTPVTSEILLELPVRDGVVQCDPERDVLYIAQVERYGKNGNIGKAFMAGFDLKYGAVASSVGHDNHNILVLGTNFEDMAAAVNRVAELGGGQVAVHDGAVTAEVAFPVLGLMSDDSAENVAEAKRKLNAEIRKMGCERIKTPFMFLSFICLAAMPDYAVTDKGFVNVWTQQVEDPILEVLK